MMMLTTQFMFMILFMVCDGAQQLNLVELGAKLLTPDQLLVYP